jgi:hypothetical protein
MKYYPYFGEAGTILIDKENYGHHKSLGNVLT